VGHPASRSVEHNTHAHSRPAPPGFCLQLSRRLIFQLSELRAPGQDRPSAHGGTTLYLHDISCAIHPNTLARYCIALVIHPIAHNHLLLTVFSLFCHLHSSIRPAVERNAFAAQRRTGGAPIPHVPCHCRRLPWPRSTSELAPRQPSREAQRGWASRPRSSESQRRQARWRWWRC
jgi:hypothetical protein